MNVRSIHTAARLSIPETVGVCTCMPRRLHIGLRLLVLVLLATRACAFWAHARAPGCHVAAVGSEGSCLEKM